MASVKLKTNMIIEGHFFKFGTIIDELKVPPRFRKRRYILREGEVDPREEELKQQMAVSEREMEEEPPREEEEPVTNIQSIRRPRRV